MPRRKTIQPEPLQVFELDDGTVVEVRDKNCWEVGRGLHKLNGFNEARDKILEMAFDDYFKPAPDDAVGGTLRYVRPSPEDDYLSSASKFVEKCAFKGFLGESGDDSAFRKRMYRAIMSNVNALRKAQEALN